MTAQLIRFPYHRTELFCSPWESKEFKMAGTLDGFIDFAVPDGGTYPLSVEEAWRLVFALIAAINDVAKVRK